MRFYSTELPKFDDTVIVSITGVEDKKLIYVKLLEYDGLVGNIMMSDISRKRKDINKFLKTHKSNPFPCSVSSRGDEIPTLVPINNKSTEKITRGMNRYYCMEKLEKLANDFAFQNKDIDPNIFYEKFLWVLSEKLEDMDTILENQFNEFVKNVQSMFALSELDKQIIDRLISQLALRITHGDISMYGTIDILVTSAHGQLGLSKLIDKLIELVSQCYYRNAPTYGFIVKSDSEDSCRDIINKIHPVLSDYAQSLGLRAVIDFNERDICIKDCVIKLTPINKTVQNTGLTTD